MLRSGEGGGDMWLAVGMGDSWRWWCRDLRRRVGRVGVAEREEKGKGKREKRGWKEGAVVY